MRRTTLSSNWALTLTFTALLAACGGSDSAGADLLELDVDDIETPTGSDAGIEMDDSAGDGTSDTGDDTAGEMTTEPGTGGNAGSDPNMTPIGIDPLNPDDGGTSMGGDAQGDGGAQGTDMPPDMNDMPPDMNDVPPMSCGSSAECGPELPYCTDAGTCVECLGTPNCGDAERPVCNVAGNACVECVENADCQSDTAKACDPVAHECVECIADGDCEDPDEACNVATHECVTACESDATCGGGTPFCAMESGVCVECVADTQCQDSTLACIDGSCTCGGDGVMCGDRCRDVQFDPDNCGDCQEQCDNAEMCAAGECQCRPGLELCADSCRNTSSDPSHCGGCDIACVDGEKCEAGSCQPSSDGCSQGLEQCEGPDGTIACVATDSDPLNCGDCNERCDREEICVEGDCVEYTVSGPSCDPDQCAGQIDEGVCCDFGGIAVCVENGSCPAAL